MSEYTPTTDEVLRSYRLPMADEQGQREGESFAEFLSRRSIEAFQQQIADREAAQRWLAEIERAAAEKAWAEGVATALNYAKREPDGITLKLVTLDGDKWENPYRRNEGEK